MTDTSQIIIFVEGLACIILLLVYKRHLFEKDLEKWSDEQLLPEKDTEDTDILLYAAACWLDELVGNAAHDPLTMLEIEKLRNALSQAGWEL